MKKRPLGKTDIEITPIGLGCWQFSQGANFVARFWDTLPDEAIRAVVETALKGGVNWFDTAEAYGSGRSEQKLAEALAALDIKRGRLSSPRSGSPSSAPPDPSPPPSTRESPAWAATPSTCTRSTTP